MHSTSPKVSVIIPAYNASEFLPRALDSVAHQSFQDLEIIVVDDGSTDGTARIAASYSSKLRLFQQENAGPAAARNRGIREARGQYVAFLDADDVWLPGMLATLTPILDREEDVGLVCADLEVFSGDRLVSASHLERMGTTRPTTNHTEFGFGDILTNNLIATSTVVARKLALEEAGLFDETLRAAEDWDLWLRVSRNERILLIAETVTRRFEHGNNLSGRTLQSDAALAVLEKAKKNYPELIKTWSVDLNQLESKIWFDRGYVNFSREDFKAARRDFLISLRNRYRARTAMLALSTFLGPSIVRRLKGRRKTNAHE